MSVCGEYVYVVSVCERREGGGGEGGGCGETTGRNSNKKYENQREGIKFKRKNTKTRNETLFRSFAKQLETLFHIFVFFSVS